METAAFTEREFRDALGQFATGVAVVTADVGGTLVGSTISSFSSVSLDPPLILFSLAKAAQSIDLWRRATWFGVTILAETQADLSARFAGRGAEKWTDVAPARTDRGVPVLRDGLVAFECEVYALYDGGDHEILVGRVLSFIAGAGPPLLVHGGRYRRLHADREPARPQAADACLPDR